MNFASLSVKTVMLLTAVFCTAGTAISQTTQSDRLAAVKERMQQLSQKMPHMPDQLRNALSGSTQNFLRSVETSNTKLELEPREGVDLRALAPSQLAKANAPRPFTTVSGPIPVSNPFPDLFFSRMTGFTQSETSTAWCGSNIVVGFNDSGSRIESLLFGPGGLSFTGVSVSSDGGLSFRDAGFVNPGPNFANALFGDPVLNCADANTFYYSQLFNTGDPFTFLSAIAVSKSTDGGSTWADPVMAIGKDFAFHILDKDWSAIDLKHPKNLYVTYTDVDFSFTTCPSPRFAIELVRSINGGATWTAPTVVDQVCSDFPTFPMVQNSQVVVDSHGIVYVAWEYFPTGQSGPTRELRIARSISKGNSFQPFSKIDDVYAVGDTFALQGTFRDGLTGNLAVDRSGTKTDGELYVTWDDGRFFSTPDLESPTGVYAFANILLSHSKDGGKTWSPAVRINTDRVALPNGSGVDHFQPAVNVDSTGKVGVCWYDRRRDPLNYRISRFCTTFGSGSSTGVNTDVGQPPWPPIHAVDNFLDPYYFGDYDTLAIDNTLASPGFVGAYSSVTTAGAPVPNQDVFLVHAE